MSFSEINVQLWWVQVPTRKPIRSVRQFMNHIDEYKQVEEDQQQEKGKTKVVPQDRRDCRLDRCNNNRPWRDFVGQFESTTTQVVSIVFREPMQQIVEKIKSKSYFKWPNKMRKDPTRRN